MLRGALLRFHGFATHLCGKIMAARRRFDVVVVLFGVLSAFLPFCPVFHGVLRSQHHRCTASLFSVLLDGFKVGPRRPFAAELQTNRLAITLATLVIHVFASTEIIRVDLKIEIKKEKEQCQNPAQSPQKSIGVAFLTTGSSSPRKSEVPLLLKRSDAAAATFANSPSFCVVMHPAK